MALRGDEHLPALTDSAAYVLTVAGRTANRSAILLAPHRLECHLYVSSRLVGLQPAAAARAPRKPSAQKVASRSSSRPRILVTADGWVPVTSVSPMLSDKDNCIPGSGRSSGQQLHREHSATRRQYNRIEQLRHHDRRKVAGVAERNCAHCAAISNLSASGNNPRSRLFAGSRDRCSINVRPLRAHHGQEHDRKMLQRQILRRIKATTTSLQRPSEHKIIPRIIKSLLIPPNIR